MIISKIKLINTYIRRTFYFFIQQLFYRHVKNSQNPEKILIVRLNHIGDLFITLPLIYCLRKKFTESNIDIVTGIWNKGLLEFQPHLFGRVYYYNTGRNLRSIKQKMNLSRKLSVLWEIKRQKYDICIDLDGSWGFLFLYFLHGVKNLSTAEFLRFHQNLQQLSLKKSRYKYDVNSMYEGDNLFEVFRKYSVPDAREEFSFFSDMKKQVKVENFFKEIKSEKKKYGIHPIASVGKKMWNPEGFARLCDFIIRERGGKVVFFGAPDNQNYIDSITEKMIEKETFSATGFNLGEFIIAVSFCDYFISLDSLAQHILQYYDKPSVVLYFEKNDIRWSRKRKNVKGLYFSQKNNIDEIISQIGKQL